MREVAVGYHWPAVVILMAVRWYLRHPLSATIMELLAERGIDVSNRSVLRWFKHSGRSWRLWRKHHGPLGRHWYTELEMGVGEQKLTGSPGSVMLRRRAGPQLGPQ